MALLQSLNETFFKTFDELSEQVLKKLLKLLSHEDLEAASVTVVSDRYKDDSIKAARRKRRGAGESTPCHQVNSNSQASHYRNFFKGSANKDAVAGFVSDSVATKAPARLPDNKIIVLVGGFADCNIVKSVTSVGTAVMENMSSTQEEADTRLMFHAIDLSKTCPRIIVHCNDTDILVLLLYYQNRGQLAEEVYLHAGHQSKATTREQYIPIHTISTELGERLCQCLPAVHALTGCDATSVFFRIGKRTAFTKLVGDVDDLHELSEFGLSFLAFQQAVTFARHFVLSLYGKKVRGANHWTI